MARFGFTTSGSYTSQSPNAADDLCVNWYPEVNEDPNGKSPMTLYPTPGLKLAYTLPGSSVPQLFTYNGRAFGISNSNFCELLSNGNVTNYGTVASSAIFPSITAGPNQIFFSSGGNGYVFTLPTNDLQQLPSSDFNGPISQVAYCDGFSLALLANSNEFQVSSPDDATTWDLSNVAEISVFPDNIVGMIVAYRQPIFFGPKQGVAYYDSGNLFPFDVVPGGFIEQGAISTTSISFMDNSAFWLGQDTRGATIAWRANGYTPARVSTHATEFAWSQYSKVSDAISFTYQDQGHTFWQIYFPTPSKTWVYDAATGLWHERKFGAGVVSSTAHRSQSHCYAFGKHLVGDWASGNVYQMAIPSQSAGVWNFATDFGNPIERLRRAPHISNEQEWIFFHQLQVDLESGLGPIPPLLDGSGNPRDPQVNLRWSDDGGHTWSNYHAQGIGQSGNYTKRVIWRRMGRSRDRVYELSATDPVPYRIIDSYLKASPGYDTAERIPTQLRKVS